MKRKQTYSLKTAVGASALLAALTLSQAKAELVYDNSPEQAKAKVVGAEDRETLRKVIRTSENVKPQAESASEIQPQAAAPVGSQPVANTAVAPAPVAQPAPVQAAPVQVAPAQAAPVQTSAEDVQNMSKAELLRRQRVREELKNEDILQERLEELRLRDEKKRTEDVLTTKTPVAQPAPVSQEAVVAPVTDRPGQQPLPLVVPAAANPAPAQTGATQGAKSAQESSGSSVAQMSTEADGSSQNFIDFTPRLGISNMTSDSAYSLKSRFSAGAALGVHVTDNIAVEIGYAYSEYGVEATSSNPYVVGYQVYNRIREPLAMKQNVLDAGMKLYLLGSDSRVRPFIGGGAGYAKSYINYDQKIIDGLRQAGYRGLTNDYELDSVLGYASAGLDIKLSKNISLGAQFKYYGVLTSNENGAINNFALAYGNGYYPTYPAYDPAQEKQILGGSLARQSFYSALVGVSFSF